ncbi:cytochrome P450 [Kitasatospora sp. NPDC096147]|uniref:cytochrome P450 n=1 Tax=Kitasatospora sp. NPDC096147 TaxID=3364093 RepID=UPI003826DC60
METLRFVSTHTLPAFVRGVASARPGVVKTYAALRQPAWSTATLRAMKRRYGGAPVLVRGLSGPVLVLLDRAEVEQFYAEPVRTLAMDAPDKHRSLSVFEPTGVICSRGDLREQRREINDRVLTAGQPVHPSCAPFLAAVREEVRSLTAGRVLDRATLQRTASRLGRRIVLGDAAADDQQLADGLFALRREANWMGLRKGRARGVAAQYAQVDARLAEYAASAAGHTLVGRARQCPDPTGTIDPIGQAHHWLLALDLVGPILCHVLLLLAAHPAEQHAAWAEVAEAGPSTGGLLGGAPDATGGGDGDAAGDGAAGAGTAGRGGAGHEGGLPRVRACVQEALRLFPPVPDLVRETRAETVWRGVTHPAGTTVLLPAAFHQRDPDQVPGGHLFVPARWLAPEARHDRVMAPFSHGGGGCPGEDLGLMVLTALVAEILRGHRVTGGRPVLDVHRPLPGSVDLPALRLGIVPR